MPLPSVLLHDHLDGGLRPETVLELADEIGYDQLPATDPAALTAWFDQSESGSLEGYLRAFDHSIAVMQSGDAIERVAYEAAIDLAADGVVYGETRFSPPLHTKRGLTPDEVIAAVSAGFRAGEEETGSRFGLIIDALRQNDNSLDLAKLAAANRSLGVVGFDLAGPEAGHPPEEHLAACRYARESGLRLTIHAGEAAGPAGVAHIASSVDRCGAERIGHGVEIINDCLIIDDEIVEAGPVASRIRDRRVPLELCPASNMATSRLQPHEHPLGVLYRAGFNVTLNTDNRLMSATSMSIELEFAQKYHGFGLNDLAVITRAALDAAFCPWDTKKAVWEEQIVPGFAGSGVELKPEWP